MNHRSLSSATGPWSRSQSCRAAPRPALPRAGPAASPEQAGEAVGPAQRRDEEDLVLVPLNPRNESNLWGLQGPGTNQVLVTFGDYRRDETVLNSSGKSAGFTLLARLSTWIIPHIRFSHLWRSILANAGGEFTSSKSPN